MTNEFKHISWPGWETVRLIGRGSFGAVYEIQRKVFDDTEKAALKMITIPQNISDIEEMHGDGYDDESITATFQSHLKSIVAEYSLMRKMSGCINIVNCDDVRYVQHDDKIGWDIFIKMELLTPLTKALPAQIPEDMVIKLGMDMCSALEMCSRYDIIHRDIKPQNIFVSPEGTYKLGDFGIAKAVEKTMGGTKIGTYKYMAPEVYNNKPYGTGADIYSLGLVLYWMLNERRMPFLPLPPAKLSTSAEDEARQRRFIGEMIPPPAHGSETLKNIVLKACAYDPKARYRSAKEMMNDLQALQEGTSVTAAKAEVSAPPAAVVIPQPQEEKSGISIRFLDGTGVVLQEKDYRPGETVIAPQMVENFQENGISYHFGGWAPEMPGVAVAPMDYYVVYEEVADIRIRFLSKDGTVLQSKDYCRGGSVTEPKMVQELEENGTRYYFEGWTPAVPKIAEKSVDCYAVYKKKRQKHWPIWAACLCVAAVGAGAVFMSGQDGAQQNVVSQPKNLTPVTETKKEESVSEKTEEKKEEKKDTSQKQTTWSDWSEKLPSYVTESDYNIEKQTLYRSKKLETTTSTSKNSMSGWELYDTISASGGFGPWSDWSTTAVSASNSRNVETQTRYRYRDKETTTSKSSSKSGWERYDVSYELGDWGDWSDWSEDSVSARDDRDVEKKTQYRYRTISASQEYGSWSNWSSWSWSAPSVSDTCQVESATFYRYYYFLCHGCGDHNPFSSACGCGSTSNSWNQTWQPISYGDSSSSSISYTSAKRQTTSLGDGQLWYFSAGNLNDTAIGTRDSNGADEVIEERYRFRTRTLEKAESYSDWSEWGDKKYSETDEREVETRKMYRYRECEEIPVYHYTRWGDWSGWSTTAASSTNKRQVETATYYRYQDKITATTYCFRRWTDWSGYSKTPVSASDSVKVETVVQYRFKSK